jgi:hypothetical protein
MFYLSIYAKALLMGFTNGLFIGRKIRNVNKFKYIPRFQCDTKERPREIKG